MTLRPAVFLAPLLFGACHATYRHNIENIVAVHTQVIGPGTPYVSLGEMQDDSLVGAVVNTVQAVRSANQTQRIADAVDPTVVGQRLQVGVAETLDQGPPFAYTDDPKSSLLELTVNSYGLNVPSLGEQGYFTYDYDVHIYLPSGKRVYTGHMTCSSAAGAPPDVAMAFGVVNNVKELKAMTDRQIQKAFNETAHWCGASLVDQLRRQAG